MKALKVGYVFVITTLLVLTITLGAAAFYPAPRLTSNLPNPPAFNTDYNSSEYKAEQARYDKESKTYQQQSRDVENARKVWSQNALIIALMAGVILLLIGALLVKINSILSVSIFFAAFILMVFGVTIISSFSDGGLFVSSSNLDLSLYKKIQFMIVTVGLCLGIWLGFTSLKQQLQS